MIAVLTGEGDGRAQFDEADVVVDCVGVVPTVKDTVAGVLVHGSATAAVG